MGSACGLNYGCKFLHMTSPKIFYISLFLPNQVVVKMFLSYPYLKNNEENSPAYIQRASSHKKKEDRLLKCLPVLLLPDDLRPVKNNKLVITFILI